MNQAMGHDAGLENDFQAALRGDHDAFARLYDRFAPLVVSVCRRRGLGSLPDQEDACQEVFIRAYRKLDEVDGARKLAAWLCAVACHVCNERRRAGVRRTRHEERAVNTLAMPSMQQQSERDRISPVEASAGSEQLERLTLALGALAEDERLAIHLYYLESDPVRSASSILGLSRSGYYKLLARARARLTELMREVKTA